MPSTTTTVYTADLVVFADDDDGIRNVLLVTRGWEPFKGRRALPGGFVEKADFAGTRDPRVASRNAAAREGGEETGITVRTDLLRYLGTWDTPGRDPRGTYSTHAYVVVLPFMPRASAGSDAEAADWVPVEQAEQELLAFDHSLILAAAWGA